MKKTIYHNFARFLFDLVLTIFWIWIPMFYFNLNEAPNALLIWIVDIGLLAFVLYLLHRKGIDHRL